MSLEERFARILVAIKRMESADSPALQNRLSPTHIRILDILYNDGGKRTFVTASMLARQLAITAASVSVAVAQLEKLGYLEKKPELSEDSRAVPLALAQAGATIADSIMSYRKKRAGILLKELSLSEREQLVALLERVVNAPQAGMVHL